MILFITHINDLLLFHSMKYQNVFVYLVIPLALLSISSLLENVQAQTNSTNETAPQQNQNMNLTTQALMKVNIFELKNSLMEATLAIVDGNLDKALTGVRDIEAQLLQVEPMPTKFLDNIHRTINAIAREDTDKALNTLTGIQVTILRAENQIFKAAMANPQVVQQFDSMESNTNEGEGYTDKEVTSSEGVRYTDKEVTSSEGVGYTDKEDTSSEGVGYTDKEVTFSEGVGYTDKEDTSSEEEEDSTDKEDTSSEEEEDSTDKEDT